MTSTGKKARKSYGNRYACKRAKAGSGSAGKGKRRATKRFGKLAVSVKAGNAESFVASMNKAA